VLPSLLAWQPDSVGLPPFTDLVGGVIPMAEPLYIKGPVVKGFGRGSKVGGLLDAVRIGCRYYAPTRMPFRDGGANNRTADSCLLRAVCNCDRLGCSSC
jgi:hypothetical protein